MGDLIEFDVVSLVVTAHQSAPATYGEAIVSQTYMSYRYPKNWFYILKHTSNLPFQSYLNAALTE